MKTTPLENWILRKTGIREKSRELLEAFQLDRIRDTINYAKTRSRFYGARLGNIRANDICGLNDIRRIPFTFPGEIREDPFQFLCVPQKEVKRIVTLRSTGTSGKEKRIFFTEEDLNRTIDFFVYGMSCLTDETDRVMVLLPGASYGSIGDLLEKALGKANIECFIHGVVTDPEETAKEIVRNNITGIVGIPVQVLNLSRMKRDTFKDNIKSVLLSTDYVPEVLIRELTEQCGCRVFTHYGMTETGYGGGVECEALNGYHMREADLYFEIVDPATGEPVPDGEWGEAVFTTLCREAMPLIRYRTGDTAAFSKSPCACGTFLKTMKRIKGRIDNKIRICENGYLFLAELDEAIFSFHEVRDYKACLAADGCLGIEIVTENEDAYERTKNIIAGSVVKTIHDKYGPSVNLRVRVSRKNELAGLTDSMTKRTITDQLQLMQQY